MFFNPKRYEKLQNISPKREICDIACQWDDETNMEELEKCVRSVEMDGLLWGASKLVKVSWLALCTLVLCCMLIDLNVINWIASSLVC